MTPTLSYHIKADFVENPSRNHFTDVPRWVELIFSNEYSPFMSLMTEVSPPKKVLISITVKVL